MTKKRCTKCGRRLDYSEFHKNKIHKDGLQYQCKECISKYQKERRILLKRETMVAFGSQCVHVENGIQCAKNVIDNLAELELSHPNDDGDEHRDLISKGRKGPPFYQALKDRNYNTDGFDVKVMCRKHHFNLDRSGKNHPLYGISPSKETRAKMSKSKIGKKNPNYGKYKEGKFNDPVWLIERYIDDGMTLQEIADLCGENLWLIRDRMIKFNITRRRACRRP